MKILKIIGKIALWLIGALVLIILSVFIWLKLHSKGETQPIVNADGTAVENSVAEIIYPEINGLKQYLLIRGVNTENPVLLMLHGGPGGPQAHMNLKYNKELEDHFVVVNWDQRGAGASYSSAIDESTMTINQFIEDTYAVSEFVKNRFGKDKIFILGHSWGSYLGMRTVHKYPETYKAYIGIGQVADLRKSEDLSYDFVYNKALELKNEKAIADLEFIGRPKNGVYENPQQAIMVERRWVTEFGGAAYGKSNSDLLDVFIMPLLKFKEYTLSQKINYFKGVPFTQGLMWSEMFENQLVDIVNEVEVPIYIFHGIHDYQTVYSEAKSYIDSLKAPRKMFYTFDKSAHLLPYNNQRAEFIDLMVNEVLKENQ